MDGSDVHRRKIVRLAVQVGDQTEQGAQAFLELVRRFFCECRKEDLFRFDIMKDDAG
jgi:hypothetical protein